MPEPITITGVLDTLGVKLAALIAGFFGSAVALKFSPQLTGFQMISSLLAGTAVAGYGEVLVSLWLHLPAVVSGGVGFLLGLGGMAIAAGVLKIAEGLAPLAIKWLERKAEK